MNGNPLLPSDVQTACRFAGFASVGLAFVFVINNFLTYGAGFPGAASVYSGIFSLAGVFQVALVLGSLGWAAWQTLRLPSFVAGAAAMENVANTVVSVAFWSVLLVGIADVTLSWIRIEELHTLFFGQDIATNIGRASWRGTYVHIPILLFATIVGLRDRRPSIAWLVLLVVLAELFIVIARFVFSYEQSFMGDLVRFWYAALFLFASALTLQQEAHVRVDVLFANFNERRKAWFNATGTVMFGVPFCWIILFLGLSSKASIINSPVLNFETAMSGFGLYVKYLMALFLLVFALSMLAQFTAVFFNALAILNGDSHEGDTNEDDPQGSNPQGGGSHGADSQTGGTQMGVTQMGSTHGNVTHGGTH